MMARTIDIHPITRIEGHAKISLHLDAQGNVADVLFHVLEFRGFEKFCQNTLAERLPFITSRVCGICPITHHLASSKALDSCFGLQITETAKKLRELLMHGQYIESHVLSLAVLSLPDLLYPEGDAKQRNVLHLYEAKPKLTKAALKLRAVGTAICQTLGRRPGHPIASKAGGVVLPLAKEEQEAILAKLTEATPLLESFTSVMREVVLRRQSLFDELGDIQTAYMGLSKNGALEFYDGEVKVSGKDGGELASFDQEGYFDHVEEKIENWSYMKFPVLKNGERFRVGPLARINIAESVPTERAGKEFAWFREQFGRPAHKTLLYHYARFIETLYSFERAEELLRDPSILAEDVQVAFDIRAGKGNGIVEAPRGTLVHSYEIDEAGKAKHVRLLVATQHNNYGFNDALKQTASKLINGGEPDEKTLNKLEMVVRAYDPCLSCSTHVAGKRRNFPVFLYDANNHLIREYGP
jgi:F420-non-reducing hydrogenase large subunit